MSFSLMFPKAVGEYSFPGCTMMLMRCAGSVFWSILPQTGELTAVWRNLDGSTDVVSIALDPATNTFALVFDIPHFLNAHPDWSPVV